MEQNPNSVSPARLYQLFWRLHLHHCVMLMFAVIISLYSLAQIRVNEADAANADALSKKYKDDDVMCTSSHHYFTFDKGTNSLNDKVVVIEEEAESEFISLKKYASFTYPEFYNKFIDIKTFKKAIKTGARYAASRMPAIDRSVTNDGVFF